MSTALRTETIVDLIEHKVSRHPHKIAIKIPKHTEGYDQISYGELQRKSGQFAATLKKRGLQKGEKVAIIGKPRTDWAIAFLGILKAGGVALPIDASWQAGEVQRVLREMDAVGAVVADAPHYEMVKDQRQLQHIVTMDRLAGGSHGERLAQQRALPKRPCRPR
jgi:long-subunit acyl-CoA synthetase (AMP-forming)